MNGNGWKYMGVGLITAGAVTVIALDKAYESLGIAYWLIGGCALVASVLGGLVAVWAERKWPSPRPDQRSHPK